MAKFIEWVVFGFYFLVLIAMGYLRMQHMNFNFFLIGLFILNIISLYFIYLIRKYEFFGRMSRELPKGENE